MDRKSLHRLLSSLEDGDIEIEEVLEKLRVLPYEEIGFA